MPRVDIEVLQSVDADVAASLAHLLPQVAGSAAPLSADVAGAVVANPATKVVVASLDGHIVGMALLLTCTTLAGTYGRVEQVAVDGEARGQRVGVRLMVELLRLAEQLGHAYVDLTSHSSREAANGLYRSIGFEPRETNFYRHNLGDLPLAR